MPVELDMIKLYWQEGAGVAVDSLDRDAKTDILALVEQIEQQQHVISGLHRRYVEDQALGREAGITYDAVRDIMNEFAMEDERGNSFGRTVELLRSLALGAAQKIAADRDRVTDGEG